MNRGMNAVVVVLVFVAGFGVLDASKAVTNEDIKDAILSMVHVIRSTEDKLERHELRERVLGDQLKKALITIDKRMKLIEPVKGTVSRLDERLAAVETILMQRDERERIQLQKTVDSVEDVQRNLPVLMEQLRNDLVAKITTERGASVSDTVIEDVVKHDVQKVAEALADRMKNLEASLSGLRDSIVGMHSVVKSVKENTEDVKKSIDDKSSESRVHLNSTEQLLSKYENKLAEYHNRVPTEINVPANFEDKNNWQGAFLQALELQKVNVAEILTDVKTMSDKLDKLPAKSDLEDARNATLDLLQTVRHDAGAHNDLSATNLNTKLQEIREDAQKHQTELAESIDKVGALTQTLSKTIAKSHDALREEIGELSKVEEVMVQTADSVLDTKRRVEYGVHQILLEVAGLVANAGKETNAAINERFDGFELMILDSESGALANLTSKIGQEIDQVWRQIGIMHQQMSASTDTLNKLQNQTDAYVNGSINVMDSMKGKVGQITGRMTEVDENLNYLLGRLSLVTQEFNQIKSGLGSALDEIRASFLAVQQKVKDAGPGPHKIASNEVDDVQK